MDAFLTIGESGRSLQQRSAWIHARARTFSTRLSVAAYNTAGMFVQASFEYVTGRPKHSVGSKSLRVVSSSSMSGLST
jgi:hypothetical protein